MNKEMKKAILEAIKGGWKANKDGFGEVLFYKHLDSGERNKIYHIILAGTEYDGIYEMTTTKGMFNGYISSDKVVLDVHNNLDYALFKGNTPKGYLDPENCKSYGYCIIRSEYDSEASFKEALLKTNLIDEEEYDIYTFQPSKEYIYKKTPKISFVG